MTELIVCRGAPRDLGLDQGRAVAGSLGSRARRRAGWRMSAPTARMTRDLLRHFPHLGERLGGLARGAGVARRELLEGFNSEPLPRGLVVGSQTAGGAILAGILGAAPGVLRLRRSEPDHGFASLDVTLPWGVSALAGVNEHGLAACVGPGRAPSTPAPETCHAPALLLIQDCLQRFDTAEKAVEWCVRRPGGGCATLLFADAAGVLAGVHVWGNERRVLVPEKSSLFGPSELPGALRLAKSCAEGDVDGAELRERVRQSNPEIEPAELLSVDAGARSLVLGGTRVLF